MDAPAPTDRPHNWGRWGADDQRGALNLLDADAVRGAAASITAGAVYGLGIPIQGRDVPLVEYRGTPMRLTLQDSTDAGAYAGLGCPDGTGAHEDVLVMASHTTSHMDALIHVYSGWSHYNGVDHTSMRAMSGAARLGIENVGGVAARAVIIDVVAHFGDAEDWVDPGRAITAADLRAALAAQGTTFGRGDVALVRTGYLQYWLHHRPTGEAAARQPGITLDAARWLAAQDAVIVGSDNAAVEVIPFDGGEFLAVHRCLLVDHGIHLLEFLDLSAPARAGHYTGMLTLGPLKVTGATGSPVNPVFIA